MNERGRIANPTVPVESVHQPCAFVPVFSTDRNVPARGLLDSHALASQLGLHLADIQPVERLVQA
jgi:hypothetical protein